MTDEEIENHVRDCERERRLNQLGAALSPVIAFLILSLLISTCSR